MSADLKIAIKFGKIYVTKKTFEKINNRNSKRNLISFCLSATTAIMSMDFKKYPMKSIISLPINVT